MNYIISASTDVGIKKDTNQDSLYAKQISAGDTKMVFAILCDGMGGLKKGEVASASVIEAYKKWSVERIPVLYAQGMPDEAIRKEWCDLATRCNESIKLYGKKSAIGLGTTVTAILLTDERYYVLNVGDSRTYEITDECRVLTRDQTVVAREVELGRLTPEQAETDSRRSVLLQCVGASDAVYPDVFYGQAKKDAVYMLCSDGFRHVITPEEIVAYFHPSRMTNDMYMRQNEMALIELNKQRREQDNISVITIRTF